MLMHMHRQKHEQRDKGTHRHRHRHKHRHRHRYRRRRGQTDTRAREHAHTHHSCPATLPLTHSLHFYCCWGWGLGAAHRSGEAGAVHAVVDEAEQPHLREHRPSVRRIPQPIHDRLIHPDEAKQPHLREGAVGSPTRALCV